MSIGLSKLKNKMLLIKTLLSNPKMIMVKPSINLFLARYMKKFRLLNVGGKLVMHSHLPALNSKAFTRFVNEHLLARSDGPTHAQIAVTNACPQQCQYCYNKNRSGGLMDTDTIIRTVRELKQMGVVWLGITGGEPLLNKDIVGIVGSIGNDCAIKLFTTGYNLTVQLAADLKRAGLFYASVSLDHWKEEEHDRIRGYPGAFRTALDAIRIFRETGGLHIGVSAVISRDMINNGQLDTFIRFIAGLDVHELWLSEAKPAVEAFRKNELVITEKERLSLVELQDRYNRQGKMTMTINYLGHFEGREHFGCNAGNKMVYIDAFGEVSPCVFLPMTFGNVRDESVSAIFTAMKKHFPTEGCCFVNKNFSLLSKYEKGRSPICKEDTLKIMNEARFGLLSEFSQLYYGTRNRECGVGR